MTEPRSFAGIILLFTLRHASKEVDDEALFSPHLDGAQNGSS